MTAQRAKSKASTQLQGCLFEQDFLVRTLGSIVQSPEVALTELVANAWDAGETILELGSEKRLELLPQDAEHMKGLLLHSADVHHAELIVGKAIYHESAQVPGKSCQLNRSMQHHLV